MKCFTGSLLVMDATEGAVENQVLSPKANLQPDNEAIAGEQVR